jgi:hypothetical protein
MTDSSRANTRARRRLVFGLAAEANVDWRTAEKWLRGGSVHVLVAQALERATGTLGFSAEVERYRGQAA